MSQTMEKVIKRILVVDGDAKTREMIADCLHCEGYECQTAGDSQEALGIINDESIGLVISDICTGVKSGIEMMNLAHAQKPDLPSIIMTGCSTEYSYPDVIRSGAVDHIAKPIGRSEMLSRIARLEREIGIRLSLMEESQENRMLRDYLENVFDNSPAIICIVDRRGCFEKVNRTFLDLIGLPFDELKQKKSFDIYPDKEALNHMLEQLRSEGRVHNFEIDIKRRDGVSRTFNLSLSLLRNDKGETTGSVAVGVDITELKTAQNKIEKLLAERNNKLALYAQSIQQSKELLDETMKDM